MTKKNNQLLMLLSAVGLMAFTACADDKYDLSDIDMTIGVGSDNGLTLPTSSTREIRLKDMMELEDNESVIIDENGDYVFLQKGDSVDDVTTIIDTISIVNKKEILPGENEVEINIPGMPVAGTVLPPGTRIPIPEGETEIELCTIKYGGEKPAEVVSLKNVGTQGSFDVNIGFSEDFQNFIPEFLTFQVEFPEYMKVNVRDKHNHIVKQEKDNILVISNVSTDETLEIGVDIETLNFVQTRDAFLKIDGETIAMEGVVKVKVAWGEGYVEGEIKKLNFVNNMEIANCYIVSATGKFNPNIDIQDLGNATVGDLPDFLTNEGVVLDLDNPQIIINIDSDLPVPGFLWGTLTAKDENGNVVKDKEGKDIELYTDRIAIDEKENKIVICKYENTPAEKNVKYVEKPEELASIIENLAKINSLSFTAGAEANDSVESTIDLGKTYTIKPSYSIKAPIAFGENAKIVYKDTLDGWNEDIKDLEFADGAYVEVTAEIENRIPAYLTLEAYAIDVKGNEIKDLKMEVVSDIKAATELDPNNSGKLLPVSSPISIKIEHEKDKEYALQSVDGIVFSFTAAASDPDSGSGNSSIKGITLNSENHSLLAKDIKVTVKGKIIIKTDD